MKSLSLAAAVAATLALAACDNGGPFGMFNDNSNAASQNVRTGPMGGTDRQMAVAMPSQMTTSYAQTAAMGDMYEIEAARLALQKARDPRVKNFAQMMITDHEGSSRQLKAALPPGVAVPNQLDAQHQAKLQELRNTAAGATFDRVYMHQQVMAHEEALALHQNYARNGEAPQLRQVAANVAPVVDNHLRTARSMVR